MLALTPDEAGRVAAVERRLRLAGALALAGAAVVGLAATFWLAATWPEAIGVVPLLVVLSVGLVVTLRSPLLSLSVAILLSLLLDGVANDFAGGKIIYGAYTLLYLVLWYGRAWARGQRIVVSGGDVAMALLLVFGVFGGALLGVMYQNPVGSMVGNIQAQVPLFLYFPVKEACVRERSGIRVVVGCILALGISAALQNAYMTSTALSSAKELWQIIDVRVAFGEMALCAAILLCVALLTSYRGKILGRIALIGLFGVLVAGLILTKSRGFWVAVALGLLVYALILRREDRRRTVAMVASGSAVFVVAALVVAGPYAILIATGIAKRLLTISSAGSADVSLINRFTESGAAWAMIKQNPILGYGWGVEYAYFSLLFQKTMRWAYVHNGYLGVWMKIGLWGLTLVVWTWFSAIRAGISTARCITLPPFARAVGGAAAGTLVAFLLVANSSPPFENASQEIIILVLWALSHGVAQRGQIEMRDIAVLAKSAP